MHVCTCVFACYHVLQTGTLPVQLQLGQDCCELFKHDPQDTSLVCKEPNAIGPYQVGEKLPTKEYSESSLFPGGNNLGESLSHHHIPSVWTVCVALLDAAVEGYSVKLQLLKLQLCPLIRVLFQHGCNEAWMCTCGLKCFGHNYWAEVIEGLKHITLKNCDALPAICTSLTDYHQATDDQCCVVTFLESHNANISHDFWVSCMFHDQ